MKAQKTDFVRHVFCCRTDSAVFYRTNSHDRTDASSHAYTGSALRTDCWMAVWTGSRIFPSIGKKCSFWNACHVPQCSVHGI